MDLTRIWLDDGAAIMSKKDDCIPMNEEANERR